METIKVEIINKSGNPMPEYATADSAGFDLRAMLDSPLEIGPMERVLVPTGIYMALPEGYECQIRPRSGLAIKHGITVLNTPGTIDADYRGEVKVILVNLSAEPFVIEDGERICQAVVHRYAKAELTSVERLSDTERGEGGFGHSGTK